MVERTANFTENEREQIGFYARQAANFGEDFIYDLVHAKAQVMKLTLVWKNSPELKALFPERDLMLHEIDVLDEVVRQARTIMQFQGTDSLSILDRESIAGGLGSIFDPDSKMGKIMSGHLGSE